MWFFLIPNRERVDDGLPVGRGRRPMWFFLSPKGRGWTMSFR
jgi:hypothetical protein